MKNIFLFIFIFMSYNSINAQTNYEDVVYLKNGSIIHGIIVEQIPNESIKIESGPNTFVYKMNEIQKLTKEKVTSQQNTNQGNLNSNNFSGLFEVVNSNQTKFYHIKNDGGNITLKYYFISNGKIYDNSWKHCRADENVFTKTNENLYSSSFNLITLRYSSVSNTIFYNNGGCSDEMRKIADISNTATVIDVAKKINSSYSSSTNNQTTPDNSDANTTTSFSYNQIDKKTYFVDNLPNFKNANIELAKIESLTTNFNVSEVQDVIKRAFENSSRFESNPRDKSVNNFSYEFTITSLNYVFDQGKKVVSNEPYAGYSCKLLLKYKLLNKNNNSTIYEETLTFEGGNPKLDTDKSNAYNLCLKQLSRTISNLILFYCPVLSNFESVESSDKKGFPKFIYLDNSKYFSSDMNIFFVLVEESNIYYKGGKLTYSNAIATCDLKGINDNKLKCKILSGEEKLKSYIDNGKKIVAVSSIIKPEKVE